MPEIVSDNPDIFQMPVEAANEVYAKTNPGLGSVLFGGGYGGGPLSQLSRAAERGTQATASWFDRMLQQGTYGAAMADAAPGGYDPALAQMPAPEVTPEMQPADYNERYAPRDINGKIIPIGDRPMAEGLAKIIGKQKTEALEREGIWRRYGESHAGLTTLGAGAVATMLDPINAASAFVPVLGEGALAAQLGGSFLARTVARIGAGAAAGTAIGVPTAGLRMALDPEEASDYGMRDALRDVFYSAAGFAALHGGIGTGLDILGGGLRARPAAPGEPVPSPGGGAAPAVDAATQNAAMRSAVGQVVEGREVDVAPVLDAAAPRVDTLTEAAPRYTTEPDHEAPGRYVAKDETGKVVATGDSPEQALTRAGGAEPRPAAPRAETITQPDFRAMIDAAGLDMGIASDRLAARLGQALAEGREVTLYPEGKRAVPIVAIDRGMMRDAEGQRWGTMGLATTRAERIEIGAGKEAPAPAAAVAPVAPRSTAAPSSLPDLAQREQATLREGFAPGVSRDELAASNDAVYGRAPEAPAEPVRGAPAAETAAQEALLEQHIAQLPPEALHPEDRVEIAKATDAVREAQSLGEGMASAASCLMGLL